MFVRVKTNKPTKKQTQTKQKSKTKQNPPTAKMLDLKNFGKYYKAEQK